jgi:hypothetical protein
MSMICAPPMMVRMSEAWPGQSTSVNWTSSYGLSRSRSGRGTYDAARQADAVSGGPQTCYL